MRGSDKFVKYDNLSWMITFGSIMKAEFKAAALLAASVLFLSVGHAGPNEASQSAGATAPAPIEKAGKAIQRGAEATVGGVKRGTNAAVRGVERGAKAAASGIQRGAQATGRAVNKVGKKVGLAKPAETEAPSNKP